MTTAPSAAARERIMRRLTIIIATALLGIPVAGQSIYRQPSDASHPTAPQVPAYAVFAGDTIRFDTAEKYERMDRELLAFTYMQSNSTLMLKRSGRWFPFIEAMLKDNGIPDDFKYLCAIESNLDPKAVSVTGATGLWQFTKVTAREFGMEVSAEVDERYNEEKETIGACAYLKRAYAKFGDWTAVAASYNCGIAGVSKRMEAQKQSSFFDLLLPEETSRYVYRILVAKMFFENPEAFGFNVPDRYKPMEISRSVLVSGEIPSLVDFAAQYGVSYAQLKRANLWLRSDKITNKDRRTYRILIPKPAQ